MLGTMRAMAHPPAPPLLVPDVDRHILQAIVRASTSEQRAVTRARIVLRSADGAPIEHIAQEVGVALMTVRLWRRRYTEAGLDGLSDAPRPGHPPTYTRADRDRLVALTMGPPPEGTTHWSVRAMAKRTGMSPSTVHRTWKGLGYKPHRTETFKFSTDPALEDKIRDVVGLYLDPPDGAFVLSVDEETQIQALDRTQHLLPIASPRQYPPELKRRAIRLVLESLDRGDERQGLVTRNARQLDIGPESLHRWVVQAEIDRGQRAGTTSEDAQRIAELERENRELRRANEILKSASAFFAAELDRPQRR